MKKMLLAAIVITSLALAGIGGTFAGFSDSEMSRDNVFELGSLDLVVAQVNQCWHGSDFREDLPWGTGLEPLFADDDASLSQTYYARELLWNKGSGDGIAYLLLRLTEDTAGIASTTTVTIWYDENGDTLQTSGETIICTLAWLDGKRIELGPAPSCEPRRFLFKIRPTRPAICPPPGCYCPDPAPCFSLKFSTEFQLVLDTSCQGFTDTETSLSYLSSPCDDYEGCSPGFWKTHSCTWSPTGYCPCQPLQSVFGAAAAYPDLDGNCLTDTLMDALKFGGGPGVEGGARILLQQAVAALLNAAHPQVNYPLSVAEVIAQVNAALASHNRDTMITLADVLDGYNNLGSPLCD